MDGKSSRGSVFPSGLQLATASAPAKLPIQQPATTIVKKQPPRRRVKLAITRVSIVLATVFTMRYFYWRFLYTMNPAAKISSMFFLALKC